MCYTKIRIHLVESYKCMQAVRNQFMAKKGASQTLVADMTKVKRRMLFLHSIVDYPDHKIVPNPANVHHGIVLHPNQNHAANGGGDKGDHIGLQEGCPSLASCHQIFPMCYTFLHSSSSTRLLLSKYSSLCLPVPSMCSFASERPLFQENCV